ncbi:uncharacterized protein LOC127261924 [Andrographis paniculata]|uniref:uncharacterized protein LOC127261924 n=1 Tax=Andrographis paniculata TaxID=175694 RepID=UPI0021E878E1|nr:uncharacterized protein LOC127261924 [Andrographis paniculata]
MNFVSNIAKKVQPAKPSSGDPPAADADPSSNADLFSNAKVVADAAQSQFRSEDYDKAKAAGAGADLLNSAAEYGKLDDTQGIGKYVDQAEGYLRQYSSSDSHSGPAAAAAADEPAGKLKTESGAPDSDDPVKTLGGDGDSDAPKSDVPAAAEPDAGDVKTTITDSIKSAIPAGGAGPDDGGKASGGGAGEYLEKAEGFLSKPPAGDGEEEKAGDYLKDGEGELKKPGEAAGEYLKQAEGVFGKSSGDGGEKAEEASEPPSAGGFGSAVKAAGGFLSK